MTVEHILITVKSCLTDETGVFEMPLKEWHGMQSPLTRTFAIHDQLRPVLNGERFEVISTSYEERN